MKNRLAITALLAISFAVLPSMRSAAQTYVPTPVTVSTEKIRNAGKIYLAHKVLDKQTLFSIAKAYGVGINEIYDSNKDLELETKGLKAGQILLIPYHENAETAEPREETVAVQDQQETESGNGEYFTYKVKYSDTLESIAEKYGTSAEVLMAYNALSDKKVIWRQTIKVPSDPSSVDVSGVMALEEARKALHDTVEEAAAEADNNVEVEIKDSLVPDNPEEKADTLEAIMPEAEETATFTGDTVRMAFILPLNTSSAPSANWYDFYAGAMLAAKAMQRSGVNCDLTILDSNKENSSQSYNHKYQIIVQPLSSDADSSYACRLGRETLLVSPVGQYGENLARRYPGVVQGPAVVKQQYQDMCDWIAEDLQVGDRIILISERGGKVTAATSAINSCFQHSGLQYSNFTCSTSDRAISKALEPYLSSGESTRIVISSENKGFINVVAQNLNILVNKKHKIVLYAHQKIRSFDTDMAALFHALNMHASLPTYVCYDDKETAAFINTFLAMYHMEPSSYAYLGYDTYKYFAGLFHEHGNHWQAAAEEGYVSGMMKDFKLVRTIAGGYVNVGIRRAVYEPDFTVTIAR